MIWHECFELKEHSPYKLKKSLTDDELLEWDKTFFGRRKRKILRNADEPILSQKQLADAGI